MNEELSEKIAAVQNFIVKQEFSTADMLVLIGFLQSAAYEHIQDTAGKVKGQ